MKKILLKTLLVISIIFMGLILAKDKLIEISVEKLCKLITGVELSIQQMNIGILDTDILIKEMKLYNPKEYKDRLMADVPEIYIDYDLSELLKNNIQLEELRIHLRELNVIRDEKNVVNVDYFKSKKQGSRTTEKQEKPKARIPAIVVNKLYFKVDKVFYKDYTKAPFPFVQEFDVSLIEEKYENIDDFYSFMQMLTSKVWKRAAIANIIKMPSMDDISATLKDVYEKGAAFFENAVKKTADKSIEMTDRTKEVLTDKSRDLKTFIKWDVEKKRAEEE
ncbi:MAG: hypothetical protein ABH869_03005 [Candidatus Omnitrophota bacterium]